MHRFAVLLIASLGCAGASPSRASDPSEVVITEPGKLDSLVGTVVTLVGVQTRSKWPTVLGADVDGDDAMSDQRVRVRGRIEKSVQNGPPMIDGEVVQGRAAGTTSYRIIDPATGKLAKPTLE